MKKGIIMYVMSTTKYRNEENKRMNVGIIGAGMIAEKMATTINGMEGVTNYAIASRDIEKSKKFAEKFQVEKAYGSYEELAADENVDLIYVATPHSHHCEHGKIALAHNKPILCEKSFTVNAREAKELIDLAKEKQVLAAEAIWTRYMPSRVMIQEIIDKGEIGEVKSLSANLGYPLTHIYRMYAPELAGGSLLDLGVYSLNFACMFLGYDIEEVVSTCTKFETGVDNQAAIILKYKNGVMANLQCNALAATEQCGIIHGTNGYIIAKNINNIDVIEVYNVDRTLRERKEVPAQITGFEYQVAACKKAIEEGNIECNEMPHDEIIKMMEIMDGLRKEWGIVYPMEEKE